MPTASAGRRASSASDLLLDAAEALHAHHIKVGDFLNTPCPMPQLIDSFAALCEQAAGRGTDVLFELMPFAKVNTLTGALELVSRRRRATTAASSSTCGTW